MIPIKYAWYRGIIVFKRFILDSTSAKKNYARQSKGDHSINQMKILYKIGYICTFP